MNWRHGIHPNNYAIGETENYYSDMSEKGWELVKCGITLSRFQKTDPKKMRYRGEGVGVELNRHCPGEVIGHLGAAGRQAKEQAQRESKYCNQHFHYRTSNPHSP